jgi:hypothetical protein
MDGMLVDSDPYLKHPDSRTRPWYSAVTSLGLTFFYHRMRYSDAEHFGTVINNLCYR